jgi:phosphorylcholine metabolism protein LicD
METNTISTKKNKKSFSKTNAAIIDALKNITWTDEQLKLWKKGRKIASIASK